MACRTYTPHRIGGTLFAERTVAELSQQGSHCSSLRTHALIDRVLLGKLTGRGRAAPLAPEAFAEVLNTKTFTNGADKLYTKTAKVLLATIDKLEYSGIEWSVTDYVQLGKALHYCSALEALCLVHMGKDEAKEVNIESTITAEHEWWRGYARADGADGDAKKKVWKLASMTHAQRPC